MITKTIATYKVAIVNVKIEYRVRKSIAIFVCFIFITGCASSKNPNDPYENYNRPMFKFNMKVDHYLIRPAAVGYTYVPEPLRDGISNFYNNLRDFISLANDILQLDGMNTMQTIMRISLNSTIGILGIIDVSSSLGLPQYKNSFGNTMKRWGWVNSNYFIIPFLPVGTVRDQLGFIPDIYFNPIFYILNDPWLSWGIFGVNLLDARSQFLDQDKVLEQTLDPYATIRDVYLQRTGAYKYPVESVSQNPVDNIDGYINEENGESVIAVPISNSNDSEVDNIIDEENQQKTGSKESAPLK